MNGEKTKLSILKNDNGKGKAQNRASQQALDNDYLNSNNKLHNVGSDKIRDMNIFLAECEGSDLICVKCVADVLTRYAEEEGKNKGKPRQIKAHN